MQFGVSDREVLQGPFMNVGRVRRVHCVKVAADAESGLPLISLFRLM